MAPIWILEVFKLMNSKVSLKLDELDGGSKWNGFIANDVVFDAVRGLVYDLYSPTIICERFTEFSGILFNHSEIHNWLPIWIR